MAALRELGGANWFALGDGDLALHVLRSYSLTRGETLSQVTANVAARWDIATRILPMSDDPVATLLDTDSGRLEFQRYFVERRCDPRVQSILFDGAEAAVPAPGVTDAILSADAVILAPSNPFLSIDPLLAIPGLRSALTQTSAPIVAVSPLIGGKAVKGPTVRLMTDLGMVVSNESIARHYAGLIDGMVIDSDDQCDMPDIVVIKCPTLMTTLADKRRVAQAALDLAARMRS